MFILCVASSYAAILMLLNSMFILNYLDIPVDHR